MTAPTLGVLVPSRGRPENARRLIRAIKEHATVDTLIFLRIDSDDVQRERYWELHSDFENEVPLKNRPHVEVLMHQGVRNGFVASANEMARWAVDDLKVDYLAILGDDVLPETPGWDRLLIDALGERLGVAYGSDGLEHKHGPDLPTHVLIPAEIFVRLGWVAMPKLRHLFVDNAWRELGRGLRNFVYVPEAKLTHLHPWAGKAKMDDTYASANDKIERERDRAVFEDWRDDWQSNIGLGAALSLLGARP